MNAWFLSFVLLELLMYQHQLHLLSHTGYRHEVLLDYVFIVLFSHAHRLRGTGVHLMSAISHWICIGSHQGLQADTGRFSGDGLGVGFLVNGRQRFWSGDRLQFESGTGASKAVDLGGVWQRLLVFVDLQKFWVNLLGSQQLEVLFLPFGQFEIVVVLLLFFELEEISPHFLSSLLILSLEFPHVVRFSHLQVQQFKQRRSNLRSKVRRVVWGLRFKYYWHL